MIKYLKNNRGVDMIKKLLLTFIMILSLTGCSEELSLENENLKNNFSEVHFINTGNSDAILIKEGDKAALIDGGDNDDEELLVNYLKEQGVESLEYLFATHPHADHIGGLDAVVDNIPIKNVYVSNGDADTKTYKDFINALSNKGLSPSVPLLGSEFKLENSTFKVLSVANTDDKNNNSLVLLYTNGEDKFLFMGDAESEIESSLKVENIDVLKVGHHGSYTSSSPEFIKMTNPKYAVILVGENNKYGHPHIETMNTLKENNIEVHRTDECSDIVFTSTSEGVKLNCNIGSYNRGNKK
jgi:beta-lactamase superfamily II metal-dependent hydrolase